MKLPKPSFLPAIAWFIITSFLLVIPGNKFPTENWFDKIWLDKWVHIFLFGIMVWLWCRAATVTNKKPQELKSLFYMFALTWFMYGVGMEFVQRYLVANRSFDGGDIIADGVGCLLGLVYSLRTYPKK